MRRSEERRAKEVVTESLPRVVSMRHVNTICFYYYITPTTYCIM